MKFFKLEELCTDIIDCPHSTPKWLNKGVPVIRNYNLNNYGINTNNLSFVDEETYINRTKRAKPEMDDIVISREAPMGVVGMIPANFKCCLGQRLVLLKVNKQKCNPKYLLYVLTSPFVQQQIKRIDLTGSIVSNLNIPDLKKLIIPVIENYQDNCALFLDAIDKKIELNNKINSELEVMAKTIYDYWFLQFEFPNEEGKPYKSAGGKMIWNDELKKEIPEGWEVNKLGDFIIENSKSSIQVNEIKNNSNGSVPFFTSGNSIYFTNDYLVDGLNCFLNTGGNADVKIFYGKASYSTDTWCIHFCNENFGYFSMYLNSIKNILSIQYFQGTGLKHLQKDLLKNMKIYYPNKKVLKKFNDMIETSYKKSSQLLIENQELISFGDFLLPLLMNGQVGFKEK